MQRMYIKRMNIINRTKVVPDLTDVINVSSCNDQRSIQQTHYIFFTVLKKNLILQFILGTGQNLHFLPIIDEK